MQAALAARARTHARHAERIRQRGEIRPDAAALCLVHEVDADNGASGDLQNLQHEVQVALEAGRVADDDHGVRSAEAQKVARDLLFGGLGAERVRARNVHEHIRFSRKAAYALRAAHGFARPVPGVLAQPGERVEHGALAHVRVPGQRNDASACNGRARHGRRDARAAATRLPAGGGNGQSHGSASRSPSGCASSTAAASALRSAMTVPRIR